MMCNKTINFLCFKFTPVLSCVVLVALSILISLGNWQVRRLKQKTDFIQKIKLNTEKLPTNIDTLDNNLEYYIKVELTGTFLENQNIFLYGRRSAAPEKDGYYLLSPFKTINNDIVLVSRGWIPQTVKNNFSHYHQSNTDAKISAITLPPEKRNFLVPENDIKQNVWFNIDLQMAKELFNLNITNFYLMQINSEDLPAGGKKLSTQYLGNIRNDHMEYAITWYSLAVCLVVLFLIKSKKTITIDSALNAIRQRESGEPHCLIFVNSQS